MIAGTIGVSIVAAILAMAVPALAQTDTNMSAPSQRAPISAPRTGAGDSMAMPSGGMDMSKAPAHFAPTRQAYTTNHRFLVTLTAVPKPIPFEKYFDLRFAVYDTKHPAKPLPDAGLALFAGMRHGLKHGFAHGMNSTPKIVDRDGVVTVSGMYFHMMGPWTLKVAVHSGSDTGVAYFQLPCCGS
ncbi:MAG TPA: hypothetical protein VME41_08150 [Stellaceae bacterium]|nr:hypothetical protein [Stellaceae bacterium]